MTALIITNGQKTWLHDVSGVMGRGDHILLDSLWGWVIYRLDDSRVLLGQSAEDVEAMV